MSEVQDYPSRLSDPASRKYETFSYLPEMSDEANPPPAPPLASPASPPTPPPPPPAPALAPS